MAGGDSGGADRARDAARRRLTQGLQSEDCKRMINGDARDSGCFVQALIQFIEVQGFFFRAKGITHTVISALQREFSSILHLGETLLRHTD